MAKIAVSCPIDTYSGYGARARDLVKALLTNKDHQVQILSQRWGNTRFGYLKDHNEDELASLIVPNLSVTPDVWIQITVPNEFQKVGKFNIDVTAGMETTLVHETWIQGVNRMDLVLTSTRHGKSSFINTQYEQKDKKTDKTTGLLKVETPIEILFEGADLTKYFPTKNIKLSLSDITEQFCYLAVGHWMRGDFGEDRKNIGYTIKSFLEAFKNKSSAPALVLKTMEVGSSIMDREKILDKIQAIRKTVKGKLPNVYLLHGEISDEEMNYLYNHPKIKVMVSFTKGEGFGRPLLEFSLIGKPIIASGWSGQTDFLDKTMSLLIGGELRNVHKSAAVKDMILEQSKWFYPNDQEVAKAYRETFKHYKRYLPLAREQRKFSKDNYSFEKMTERLHSILDSKLPDFPKQVELSLPKLNLPKLKEA